MNLNELSEAEIFMVLFNASACYDFDAYDSESISLEEAESILIDRTEKGLEWTFQEFRGRKLCVDLCEDDSNEIDFKKYNSVNGTKLAESELEMYVLDRDV